MKPTNLFLFALLLAVSFSCSSGPDAPPVADEQVDTNRFRQPQNPYAPTDISPMDMAYYPADYPVLNMTGKTSGPPVARVIYSRPHLQGRRMFGQILQYDKPWRLGANEATELQTFQEVKIFDKKIPPGRYVLYAIPHGKTWTIAINRNVDSWGLKMDSTADLQRFEIPVTSSNPQLEYFTMSFETAEGGADLIMGWDDVLARLPLRWD